MSSMDRYILENGKPVKESDLHKWATWFEKSAQDRRVAVDHIGTSNISTVFLGIDHNWSEGEPVLWETMVFGGPLDQEQERCSGTREQAEAMHVKMVERVKQATL